MDRPDIWEEEGAVFIRTLFGEVARSCFPALSLDDMIRDERWRTAVRAEGGAPFVTRMPSVPCRFRRLIFSFPTARLSPLPVSNKA
jgi:hypothetical protein